VTRRRAGAILGGLLLAVTACAESRTEPPTIRVGSKSFTESYILAEMVAQLVDETGEARAERRLGLGGTGIVYGALASGDIDVYPEYTGTMLTVVFGEDEPQESAESTYDRAKELYEEKGFTLFAMTPFSDSDALAVTSAYAEEEGLEEIGDLCGRIDLWDASCFHPGSRAEFTLIDFALSDHYGELIDILNRNGRFSVHTRNLLGVD